MKNLLLIFFALTLSCCDKDNEPRPIAEIDKLPPATQTGADKIGCLLDGKAFLPGKYNNATNCYYQFTNGGYYFHVSLSYTVYGSTNNILTGLAVNSGGVPISEGTILILKENTQNSPSGFYQYQYYPTYTTSTETGELKITKLDPVNYIVSGTFWYNIKDYQGNLHKITDGRFDMHYTN